MKYILLFTAHVSPRCECPKLAKCLWQIFIRCTVVHSHDSVDGRNPAPVDMDNIPSFTGLYTPGGAGFLPSTVSLNPPHFGFGFHSHMLIKSSKIFPKTPRWFPSFTRNCWHFEHFEEIPLSFFFSWNSCREKTLYKHNINAIGTFLMNCFWSNQRFGLVSTNYEPSLSTNN